MKIRTERLSHSIHSIASSEILTFSQEKDHNFWIISIIEVILSKDESYADVYVSSHEDEENLPKFLAPSAKIIEHAIGKNLGIRRSPKIRFRIKKNLKSAGDILSLIHSLDKQYGLSEESV